MLVRSVFRLAVCTTALTASVAAQCNGGSQPCQTIAGVISDSAGGPLVAGTTYVVTGPLQVPTGQTLTIQPGAVLKFVREFTLPASLTVFGTLVADGTAAQPITFTSWHDDTVAGNTDGMSVVPQAGDWKGVSFGNTTGNVLRHCVFRYAGRNTGPFVDTGTEDLVIDQCSFAFGNRDAIRSGSGVDVTVTDCSFSDMRRAFAEITIDSVAKCSGNTTANMTDPEDLLAVRLNGTTTSLGASATWTSANTLNGSGVLVFESSVRVPVGTTLTLGNGLIFKFTNQSHGLDVLGTLDTTSVTSQLVFTTIDDDQFGGDTGGDGPSTPMPGSWRAVTFSFQATASTLRHALVRYAGSGNGSGVSIGSSDVTLDTTTIESCQGPGLVIGFGETPVVTSCAFDANLRPVDALPIEALPNFTNNTAANNIETDALVLGSGTFGGTLTLGPQNALGGGAFVIDGGITISGSLTLGPGTVLKFDGTGFVFSVTGTLIAAGTSAQPVVFTTFADDAFGGDTNKDGTGTTPSPGDWRGLVLGNNAGASDLDHVRVRYGGAAGVPGIEIGNSAPTLHDCTVELCAAAGLEVGSGGMPVVDGCAFVDNGGAAITGLRLQALGGFSNNTASGNGGGDAMRFGFSVVNQDLTLDAAATLNQTGEYVFTSLISVSSTRTLTLGPGLVLKFTSSAGLSVGGALVATSGGVLTDVDDDSVGTDANGDGPTTGSPGGWQGVDLTAPGSRLTGVEIRFASSPAVFAGNQDIELKSCTIASSSGDGIVFGQAVAPTVKGCSFEDNQRALPPVGVPALQNFQGNSASGNTAGDYVAVSSLGSGSNVVMHQKMGFNQSRVLVFEQLASGSSNLSLTIEAGTILEFRPGAGLVFTGQTLVNGTVDAPVVFTSVRDDQYGGDTLGDGKTGPAPGDWVGLTFLSTAGTSVLCNAIVRFAGEGGGAAVELNMANVTFKNPLIEFNLGAGIDVNGNSIPTIVGGAIENNGGMAIEGLTWGALGNISGITASGNANGNTTVITSPLVGGEFEIFEHSYFGSAIVVTVSPQIGAGDGLTFFPGVVIKAADPSVVFEGTTVSTLGYVSTRGTAARPVVFTTIEDDEYGGDTNGDGTMTTPAPGAWIGFEKPTVLEHALVRYAGAGDVAAVRGGLVFDGTRVEHGLSHGFDLGETPEEITFPHVSDCVAFDNGGAGFRMFGGTIKWSTAAGNAGLGMDVTRSQVVACNSWANTAGNFPALAPRNAIPGPIGVPLGTTIWYSNGIGGFGTCPTVPPLGLCVEYGWQNTDVDPMFVDLPNGDLRLMPSSPLLGMVPATDTIQASPAINLPFVVEAWISRTFDQGPGADADDNSRIIDHDMQGGLAYRADAGAFEFAPFRMSVTGTGRRGETHELVTTGPLASIAYFAGFDPAGLPPVNVPPIGYWMLGSIGGLVPVGSAFTGQPLEFTVPNTAALVDTEFVLQGVALPLTPPAMLTNGWGARVY